MFVDCVCSIVSNLLRAYETRPKLLQEHRHQHTIFPHSLIMQSKQPRRLHVELKVNQKGKAKIMSHLAILCRIHILHTRYICFKNRASLLKVGLWTATVRVSHVERQLGSTIPSSRLV